MNKTKVGVLGIPYDLNSSFMKGSAEGPKAIIKALYSSSANMSTESCIDLSTNKTWKIMEDLSISSFEKDIYKGVEAALRKNEKIISLGGDHSIVFPIMKAYSETYKDLTVIQFDAHGDLYEDFEGNYYSHASPFARIMEHKLISRLIQVGIRTMTPHQRDQVAKYNVEVITMENWDELLSIQLAGNIYISLDLDVLDPAFAPGVSHHEPGGVSTRHLITTLQKISAPIVGADIVELNPTRDISNMTAMVAAKLLKELIDKML